MCGGGEIGYGFAVVIVIHVCGYVFVCLCSGALLAALSLSPAIATMAVLVLMAVLCWFQCFFVGVVVFPSFVTGCNDNGNGGPTGLYSLRKYKKQND